MVRLRNLEAHPSFSQQEIRPLIYKDIATIFGHTIKSTYLTCVSATLSSVDHDLYYRKTYWYRGQQPICACDIEVPPVWRLREQIYWVCNRKNLHETMGQVLDPTLKPLPSAQFCLRPLEYLGVSFYHLLWGFPLIWLPQAYSFQSSFGSISCTNFPSDLSQSHQLLHDRSRLIPDWPSPANRLAKPVVSKLKMILLLAPIPPNYLVDQSKSLNKLTASLPYHYSRFVTTTSQSAPVPSIGIFTLTVWLLGLFP